jgi:hypothetical protein
MREIRLNEQFCIGGKWLRIIRIEKTEAIVEEMKTGKKWTHGVDNLKCILHTIGRELTI